MLTHQIKSALVATEGLVGVQDALFATGGDLYVASVDLEDHDGNLVGTLRATDEGWELRTFHSDPEPEPCQHGGNVIPLHEGMFGHVAGKRI